jgi:quinoprotein glucose dehydrogenase
MCNRSLPKRQIVVKKTAMKKSILAGLALCLCGTAMANPGDWASYGYDQSGIRFSPLTQITPANVSQLKPIWTYHMDPAWSAGGDSKKSRPWSEQTPLVINSVMFLGTPYGRVLALDADTGKELWVYNLPMSNQPSTRGLAYWPGDNGHAPEIVFGTQLGLLIALDAKTGQPVKGFANDGILDLKTPDVMKGFKGEYGMSAPPNIYKNLIILNSRVQERPQLGPSGDVRAVDARTGKFVWTFHTIPSAGEKFNGTWEGDSWKNRSGTNVWNMNTVDTDRGIAYLAIGAPTVDKDGTDRHGANLFSDSVVAVNAATGKYLWHFQATHHDIWDYDLNTPPTLLDVKKDGKIIPAVAVMNKPGLLFLLNRVTGEPIYPVTEAPVPASSLPGERAWPTQPVPSKPPQLTRSSFTLNEVATVTPELHVFCQGLIDQERVQPTTTRYTPIPRDNPIVNFPANEGGPEWAGGSFDPKLGLFIVNTNEFGYIMKQVPDATGNGWTTQTKRFQMGDNGMLCQQPPWGDLTAINVSTGEIAWRHNFGITDTLPAALENTGRPNTGGSITTASGLIFIGATDDARFRAFETKSGTELWTYKLDYAAHATPVTYLGKTGKQYVAVVATGGTYLFSKTGGDSLVAFALP